MGGGEANVDVLGHVFGFFAGLACGLAVANVDLAKMTVQDQQRAGGFAVALIAAAWLYGLG